MYLWLLVNLVLDIGWTIGMHWRCLWYYIIPNDFLGYTKYKWNSAEIFTRTLGIHCWFHFFKRLFSIVIITFGKIQKPTKKTHNSIHFDGFGKRFTQLHTICIGSSSHYIANKAVMGNLYRIQDQNRHKSPFHLDNWRRTKPSIRHKWPSHPQDATVSDRPFASDGNMQ